MVGLFSYVILMQVRILGLLPLVPRTVLILILRVRRLLDTQHFYLPLATPCFSHTPDLYTLKMSVEEKGMGPRT